jgi:hypothetical protein
MHILMIEDDVLSAWSSDHDLVYDDKKHRVRVKDDAIPGMHYDDEAY